MNRDVASIVVILGAGFSTIASTVTNLTVYDGSGGGFVALVPIAFAFLIAAGELYDRGNNNPDLPDGLTDDEIRDLRGGPDA